MGEVGGGIEEVYIYHPCIFCAKLNGTRRKCRLVLMRMDALMSALQKPTHIPALHELLHARTITLQPASSHLQIDMGGLLELKVNRWHGCRLLSQTS